MRSCSRATTTSSVAGAGASSVLMPMRTMRRSVWYMARLEVVPAVRQVERFVDQRKVGNDVADDRMLDRGPVAPRRVLRMTAADHAVGCTFERNEHRTAPALDVARG